MCLALYIYRERETVLYGIQCVRSKRSVSRCRCKIVFVFCGYRFGLRLIINDQIQGSDVSARGYYNLLC